MTTLLIARAARIDVDDTASIDGLTLETTGMRLVVAGHVGPLIAALGGVPQGVAAAAVHAATFGELTLVPGRARARSGELRLLGRDVIAREHLPFVGAAPFDPPLPMSWSAASYVRECARLGSAGRGERASRAEIARRAADALERTALSSARKKSIQLLHPAERRALVLAAASVWGPDVIVADRPLAGLDARASQFVHAALEAVSRDRALVASVGRLAPGTAEGTLARSASDIAAFVAGELSLFGSPDAVLVGQSVYRMSVRSNAEALRSALEERGATLDGGPTHFSLRLAEGQDASFVLGLASEVRAAVVEIVPVV